MIEANEPIRTDDLLVKLNLKAPTLHRRLNILEEDGFIVRRRERVATFWSRTSKPYDTTTVSAEWTSPEKTRTPSERSTRNPDPLMSDIERKNAAAERRLHSRETKLLQTVLGAVLLGPLRLIEIASRTELAQRNCERALRILTARSILEKRQVGRHMLYGIVGDFRERPLPNLSGPESKSHKKPAANKALPKWMQANIKEGTIA